MPIKRKRSTRRKPAAGSRKMPAARSKTPKAGGISAMTSVQLKELRKTVAELTTRLHKEKNAHSAALSLVGEAKKAHKTVLGQLKSLKNQGVRLTKELKRAMMDSDKHKSARQAALARLVGVRAELGHRTEELKRKSEELANLLMDSASRARSIILSQGSSASSAKTIETESVTEETQEKEESTRESSIERKLHPERKD
jgi:hypothetical protein